MKNEIFLDALYGNNIFSFNLYSDDEYLELFA